MTPGQQARGAWFYSMELKLYDTLTCGPTVYDFAHIGNARPVIVFDVLFRLLRHLYGAQHVTYVRNITDVEDKINARAAEEYPNLPLNEAILRVTKATEDQFHEDVDALGCLRPTREPRATEHIVEMRALIEQLVASGNAYVADDHVLFSVASMPDYGKLSKRPLDEMIAGARVEVAPYKRDPMDFVLWKPSKSGEPAWPSPSGIVAPGRPGWHIECSAMSDKWLWTEALARLSPSARAHPHQFDIHGGGIDLVFPHHENEIAQSRSAFHTPAMANFWMHNGFLQVEGEKMSKSLGNFVTIHELLKAERFGGRAWEGEVVRLSMLTTHYTQPIDWTFKLLKEAQLVWENWKRLVAHVALIRDVLLPDKQVMEALADDLNTPLALSRLHQIAKESLRDESLRETLYDSLVFLGLLPNGFVLAETIVERLRKDLRVPVPLTQVEITLSRPAIEAKTLDALPSSANTAATISTVSLLLTGKFTVTSFVDEWTKYNPNYISERDRLFVERAIGIKELNQLMESRIRARAEKNFRKSDRIRDDLLGFGISIKDAQNLPAWEIALDVKTKSVRPPESIGGRLYKLLIWLDVKVVALIGSLRRLLRGRP
jgi:cysteinyl-tRNA synthetase